METLTFPPAFVTYGWCRTSYNAVRSLGRYGIEVHVGDASRLAMARYSRYARSFTRLPDFFLDPDQYFEAVRDALRKTGAKVLIPGHEDVGIFSRRRNELPSEVLTALPDWSSYALAEDKLGILDVANEVACPVPLTVQTHPAAKLTELARSLEWPVIIKTRAGNSAKGVRIANGPEDFFHNIHELVDMFKLTDDRWPIVQEYLPGEAAGVCLLYRHGCCQAVFSERYLRCKEPGKFGTSTLRESFENSAMVAHAIAVMDRLQWHGIAHLDFIADRYGTFKLIEINPRLWGALALAIHSGIDFPCLWYRMALGLTNKEPPTFNRGTRCRWILGDCLAWVELFKRGRFIDGWKLLIPERACHHDDLYLSDPLPLFFEFLDYGSKFIKSKGSTNPVKANMVR